MEGPASTCRVSEQHCFWLRRTNEIRSKLTQALKIYEQDKIYCNEAARTYFVLSEVATARGNEVQGDKWRSRAKELLREITKAEYPGPVTEEDYDELIMFWSR